MLACCCATGNILAQPQKQDSESANSGATCATPAASLLNQKSKSQPYKRPAFHPPTPGGSDIESTDRQPAEPTPVQSPTISDPDPTNTGPTDTGPTDTDPTDPGPTDTDSTITTEPTELPEANRLQHDQPKHIDQPSGPELNAPGTISVPAVDAFPDPDSDSALPTLPPDGSCPTDLVPADICPPVEINFCDSGISAATTRFSIRPNRRRGRGGPLRPLRGRADDCVTYDESAGLIPWPNGQEHNLDLATMAPGSAGLMQPAMTPPAGIGSAPGGNAIEANGNFFQPAQTAQTAPGLGRDSGLPFSPASTNHATDVTQLPGSRVPAEGLSDNITSNGIVIHPPMLQPFNRNQHTFVIENRGEADAEDVIIEISVDEGDRIVAALPGNSVTSDQVSMFKFPKILSGESIPIHVTAVSGDRSPVEFSASLISRAVYSFHIHDGGQPAKLSKVSYQNEQGLPTPPRSDSGSGPVRVTNPFFDQRPQHPNQATLNRQHYRH